MIPLVDLKASHAAVKDEVMQGLEKVMNNTAFVGGPDVAEFEKEYAVFVGAKHCIGVANGTDALELVVRALKLGPNDGVLVPTNSFIASALAVQRANAKVVLVDCDQDGLIDVDDAARKVDGSTKAIMPVHLFGQCAPMEKVEALARDAKLLVIEDAAQAQGAKRNGKTAGTFGIGAGTSFYPGKNLGAYGDAGGVTTNDDALAKQIKALRNYGSEVKYLHPETGFNSRLDTVQAVVLRAKLKRLAAGNAARRAAAERYQSLLQGVGEVRLPRAVPGNEHIWHLYVVRVAAAQRDAVLKRLHDSGVGAGIHYPHPIHLTGAFAHLNLARGAFPVAESMMAEMISLPMFPEITEAQQATVAQALKAALSQA